MATLTQPVGRQETTMRYLIVAVLLAGCATVPPGVGVVMRGPVGAGAAGRVEQAQAEDVCNREVPQPNIPGFEACMAKHGFPYGPTYFYRAGGSPAAFKAEFQECMRTPVTAPPAPLTPVASVGVSLMRCLEKRGWELRAGTP